MIDDRLTYEGMISSLGSLADCFTIELFDVLPSTNFYLKAHAADLSPWHIVIADAQSAGRGRIGRHFFSPAGTGIYMSVLMHPGLSADMLPLITPAAAVAVSRAIDGCTELRSEIKWVNDIYIGGKKVCGILTEATGDNIILGIGINVYRPEADFPEEIKNLSGAVLEKREDGKRCAIAAAVLRNLFEMFTDFSSEKFIQEYRQRSMLIGKHVSIVDAGSLELSEKVTVTGIDDSCRLIVRRSDGTEYMISSGEVSVRPDGLGW